MTSSLRQRLRVKNAFMLSGIPTAQRKKLAKQILGLGGVYMDEEGFRPACSHLICGRLTRSEKFLGACASGKWVLKKEYIEACVAAGSWVPEIPYEWTAETADVASDSSLVQAPRHWRIAVEYGQKKAFAGWNVAVVVSCPKKRIVYKRLLSYGGAVVFNLQIPVTRPAKVSTMLTYVFVDDELKTEILDLIDYGVMCLKPHFIGDFLIQVSRPDPIDFLITRESPHHSPGIVTLTPDINLTCSQSTDTSFSSNADVSENTNKLLQSPQKIAPAVKKVGLRSRQAVNLNCKTTKSNLSQTSIGHFFSSAPQSPKTIISELISNSLPPIPPLNQSTPKCLSFSLNKTFVTLSSLLDSPPCRMSLSSISSESPQSSVISFNTVRESKSSSYTTSESSRSLSSNSRYSTRSKSHSSAETTPQSSLEQSSASGINRKIEVSIQGVSTKRKLTDNDLELALKITKKRKIAAKESWQPSCFGVHPSRNTVMKTELKATSWQLADSFTETIHTCFDENFLFYALDMTKSCVSQHMYPQSKTLNIIMTNALQGDSSPLLAQKAYALLRWILDLHPINTASLQKVYLNSLKDPESPESGQEWEFLSNVLRNAIQTATEPGEDNSTQQESCTLLAEYLVAMLENEFGYYLSRVSERAKVGGYTRPSLFAQIVWSRGNIVSMNYACRDLFAFLSDCLSAICSEDLQLKMSRCLMSLIAMMAECFKSTDYVSANQQGVKILMNEKLMTLGKEIAGKIRYSMLNHETIFNQVINAIRPTWLRLSVCFSLLQSMDDSLLPSSNLMEEAISMETIVKKYFFLLPNLQRSATPHKKMIRNENTNLTTRSSAKPHTQSSSRRKEKKMTRLLARSNKRNSKGESVLHTVCIKNEVDALRDFLKVPGIDVNCTDNAGWTPLHEACNHGHIQCVLELMKYRPPSTITDHFNKASSASRRLNLLAEAEDGITPLHDAVCNNRIDIARLLLKHGGPALLQSRTKSKGLLPMDCVKSDEMMMILAAAAREGSSDRSGSSQESLLSSQSSFTNYSEDLPDSDVYNDVLGTSRAALTASAEDCVRYIATLMHVITAYVELENLTSVINALSTNIMSSSGNETEVLFDEVHGSKNDGDDLRVEEHEVIRLKQDLNIISKLKNYANNFENHLRKIADGNDFNSVQRNLLHFRLLTDTNMLPW